MSEDNIEFNLSEDHICSHCWHEQPNGSQVCCWCGNECFYDLAARLHGPYKPVTANAITTVLTTAEMDPDEDIISFHSDEGFVCEECGNYVAPLCGDGRTNLCNDCSPFVTIIDQDTNLA